MQENEILAQYGRPGWKIVSRTQDVEEYKDETPGSPTRGQTKTRPTGTITWEIVDPNNPHGKPDTVVVKLESGGPGEASPGRSGGYTPVAGPTAAVAEPPRTPTPTGQMDRIDAQGNVIPPGDVTTRAAKLRDPVMGTVIDLPDTASTQRPTVVQGQRGQMWSWDGQDLKELQPGTPERPTLVQAAGGAIYAYDGNKLSVLQAGKPEPKEGDTRPNVENGYNVTQSYLGGDWVTTKYGDPAKPGQPTEGQTRPSVREGFNVTETYQGGSWNVTDVGTRETPLTPTSLTTSSDQPYIARTDETGKVVYEPNKNYQPKTRAQIASRTGQLQTVMQSKGADIQKRVNDRTITPEQGLQEWNSWYDQNINAEMAGLQAAAEEEAYARGKEQAATRTAAFTAAEAAGRGAVDAYRAAGLTRVGPGAAEAMKQTGAGSRFLGDPSAAFTQGKDPRDLYTEAVANALKDISPTAAQIAGGAQPNYAALNPSAMLARTSWTPGAVPPPAAAPAAAPAPGEWPAAATTPIIVNEAGEKQWGYPMQTGQWTPPADTTGFGGPIGNDPMAAAMAVAQAQAAPAPVAASAAAPVAPTRRVARQAYIAPAPAAAPAFNSEQYAPTPMESLSRLGTGFEPQAPGFGYDPSNIQVALPPPVAAPVEYVPPQYQFPGFEGIMGAAQAAYRAVPRVRFGPGGWRNPNA